MVGYSVGNKQSLSSLYLCAQCLLILRNAVQLTNCGHRFCQSCLEEQQKNIIVCCECQEKTDGQKLIIDRGFKNDMQTLNIVCGLCDWTGILRNYESHLNQSHPNPICHYCEGQFSSINDLNRHHQYECKRMLISCPFSEFGCTEKILRSHLSEHFGGEQHQRTIMNTIHQMKSGLSLSSSTKNSTQADLETINETLDALTGGVEVISDDIERLNLESVSHQNTLASLEKDTTVLRKSIQEQNGFLDTLKLNQEIVQQDIGTMRQKLNEINTCSCDGTLTWKIVNLKEKMVEAQSNQQIFIYSPPFYSSPTGYKMRARLHLNGDGAGHNTHLSIYFILMRGEYDAILKFPFDIQVIFCLYDQTNQQHHIVGSLQPDIKSFAFQRPHLEMNEAIGIEKFVPLKLIHQDKSPYIRDDMMFIQVMLDFIGISETMLSHGFKLNPALTNTKQQSLILEQQKQSKISSTGKNKTMDAIT